MSRTAAQQRLESFIRNLAMMTLAQLSEQYDEVTEAADGQEHLDHYRRMLDAIEAIADLKFPEQWKDYRDSLWFEDAVGASA